jgi:HSP20 family molecular chaperone IbpA
MAEKETKELTVTEKQEVAPHAEQTKPGPVYRPPVDILENEAEIVLLADLPGVGPEDLTIDLRENTLSLTGEIGGEAEESGETVMTEYGVGRYHRQFSLSEKIDQERIEANLEAGVLRLTLPKVSRAVPRRITVNAA